MVSRHSAHSESVRNILCLRNGAFGSAVMIQVKIDLFLLAYLMLVLFIHIGVCPFLRKLTIIFISIWSSKL